MRKVKIIARENVIKADLSGTHDDEGLKFFENHIEKVVEIKDEDGRERAVNLFTEEYPQTRLWDFEIEEIFES